MEKIEMENMKQIITKQNHNQGGIAEIIEKFIEN